jgi:hypothetical protein
LCFPARAIAWLKVCGCARGDDLMTTGRLKMSLMRMLLGCVRSISPRRRAGSFRPGTFPILVGLVSLALAEPGFLAPHSIAYANPNTVNMLPSMKTTVLVVHTHTGPVLHAVTRLGGHTFTQVLALTAHPTGGACPILNLHLGPIDLNLLGLDVTTSEICLKITAFQNGGLLGTLLCDVANLLDQGIPLSTILSSLTQAQLSELLSGLESLINDALTAVTTTGPPGTRGASTLAVIGNAAGSCDVLNLSLGPINLNLLGLVVNLNNCNGGPAMVDITAIPADGLLGQLLCGLDNLLDIGGTSKAILGLLTMIQQVISMLL